MDRAADCAARSTDPSAHLWRVERRRHYGGIPVRLTGAVLPYDDAFGTLQLVRASREVVSAVLFPVSCYLLASRWNKHLSRRWTKNLAEHPAASWPGRGPSSPAAVVWVLSSHEARGR